MDQNLEKNILKSLHIQTPLFESKPLSKVSGKRILLKMECFQPTGSLSSTTPIIDILDVQPGVHINAVGSHSEQMCELGSQLICQAKIVVDLRSAALAEAGEIIQNIRAGLLKENSLSELGEIILDASLGRKSPDQITFFKSVGLAIQDISVAQYALNAAKEHNQGSIVEL